MKKPIFALIIAAGALVPTALPAALSDSIRFTNHRGSKDLYEEREDGFPDFIFVYNVDPKRQQPDPSQFGKPLALREVDGGPITDVVGVANGGGTRPNYTISFMSAGSLTKADDFLEMAHDYFGDDESKWTIEVETGGTYPIDRFINRDFCHGCTGTFQSYTCEEGAACPRAPDGGSAVALLGIALAGIEGLRRKLRAA